MNRPTDERGEPLNLARECLARWAEDPATAGRTAFTFAYDPTDAGRDEAWSFAELWERVQRIGRGLLARGLEPGDRVLLRLPHSPDYAFAFFGATVAGLLPIPASPQLTAEEAAFLLDDSRARGMVIGDGRGLDGFDGVEVTAGELPELDGPGPLPETRAEDPAFLIYTSGTTSKPKGVLHAHRSILGRRMTRDGWHRVAEGDITLHAGTLNWSYTLAVGLMDSWAGGAHAVLYGGEAAPAVWPRLIERLGVTVFMAVPTVYRQMLKYAEIDRARLGSLRHVICAGEPLPPSLLEEWRERGGTEMYESLGMTELSTYISSGPATPVRPGSPGRAQAGRNVVILAADGESTAPLPPGEVGLLAVHRSDPSLMLGYWRRPEEDAAVRRGEWFVGGDLAAIDEDGYVWFHGRADDVIKSFGYRLSPVEIEAVLEAHPGVHEAAVIGVEVEELKTLITACIVPHEGAELTDEALTAHVAEHLAEYKRPHAYHYLDALPRTRNGKLQRSSLLELLRAET